MKAHRKKRYMQKIEMATERLKYAEKWIDSSRYDEKSKFAVYKCFQEAVECITDIFSMILKDKKRIPKDDYTNIEEIIKLKILDVEFKSAITEANGLRNRLVHEYNGINDRIALDSIEDLLSNISKILGMVKKWLAKEK